MSEKDNTSKAKEKQYHHLTKEERLKIESLINQKRFCDVIEKELGMRKRR